MKMKRKRWKWIGVLFMVLACIVVGGLASAEDIDIFGTPGLLRPNVLIILDNSTSMVLNRVSDGTGRTRFAAAKDEITKVINQSQNINIGLMVYNKDARGGKIIYQIKNNLAPGYPGDPTIKEELIKALQQNDIVPSTFLLNATYTPLAETLAEAGLYFAGQRSYFNTSDPNAMPYKSPIIASCQENYIILVTDGVPTEDLDRLVRGEVEYLNGERLGDVDHDGADPGNPIPSDGLGSDSSHYLDDVAQFLHTRDLSDSLEGDQVINTYVIGIGLDEPLLKRTADVDHGGGEYFPNKGASELAGILNGIFVDIATPTSVFVAPVVPISQANRTYSSDSLYMSLFKPKKDGRWNGNLKKYTLNADGTINGFDPETGEISSSAKSAWTGTADGNNLFAGGVGEKLKATVSGDTRKIYFNVEDDLKAFDTGNGDLTAAMLGVDSDKRDALIADIRGPGRTWEKEEDGTAPEDEGWIMGDILHSQPVVASLGGGTFIFVGANDGMLHCFHDANGEEAWAFIPDDLLPKLKNLSDSIPNHDYFVDGSPRLYSTEDSKILFFGERRGGDYYHALNVTDPVKPVHKYRIESDILGEGNEKLGQSWGKPLIGQIKTAEASSAKVLILPGGYDTNQDGTPPEHETDSLGRAVFAVDADNGVLVSKLRFANDGVNADMTHSIVDLSGADSDGDGYIDRVYAGDMYAQIFAFRDKDGNGDWEKQLLFTASKENEHRKIFGAPDIATITSPAEADGTRKTGEMVFFGTGDRAHPNDTSVANYIYAVKNYWDDASKNITVDTAAGGEGVLCNLTEDLIQEGNEAQQNDTVQCLTRPENRGWYFKLENEGEQIVGSPLVFNGVVYFTTYTPPKATTTIEDGNYEVLCDAATTGGTGRFYAVDARTAAAVLDLDTGNPDNLEKSDREVIISDTMPSEPVIIITKDGPLVGSGGGGQPPQMKFITPPLRPDLHMQYWRDMTR